MATAYSILRNYGNYIQPYDFNFLQKAMEYKEQKYDANLAKIQNTLNQFTSLDIVKTEDKMYLYDRLQTLLNSVNGNSVDLSNNGYTAQIQNHISQAIDDSVINAIDGTRKYREWEKEVEYYKKERPDLYAVQNEMFGQRVVQKWLNDGKVGQKWAGAHFTPYTNYSDKYFKRFETLAKTRPEEVISIPDGQGHIVTKKRKEFNASEIRGYVMNSLTSQERQQLKIDGWYNFGNVTPEDANKYLDLHYDERIKSFEAQKGALKLKLDSPNVDSNLKDIYKQDLKLLENQQQNFTSRYKDIKESNSTEDIGGFLQQESFVNGLVSAFSFRELGIEYKNDASFWADKKHNLELLKLQNNIDSNGRGSNASSPPSSFTTRGKETELKKNKQSSQDTVYKELERIKQGIKSQVEKLYGGLPKGEDGNYTKEIQAIIGGFKSEHPDLDENSYEFKYGLLSALWDSGFRTEDFLQGFDEVLALENEHNALNGAVKNYNKQITASIYNDGNLGNVTYDSVRDNDEIPISYRDSEGKEVKTNLTDFTRQKWEEYKRNNNPNITLKDYITNVFIKDENYKNLVAKNFAGSKLFDILKSNGNALGDYSFTQVPYTDEELQDKLPDLRDALIQIATLNGEDISLEDLFDIKRQHYVDGDGNIRGLSNLNALVQGAKTTFGVIGESVKSLFGANNEEKGILERAYEYTSEYNYIQLKNPDDVPEKAKKTYDLIARLANGQQGSKGLVNKFTVDDSVSEDAYANKQVGIGNKAEAEVVKNANEELEKKLLQNIVITPEKGSNEEKELKQRVSQLTDEEGNPIVYSDDASMGYVFNLEKNVIEVYQNTKGKGDKVNQKIIGELNFNDLERDKINGQKSYIYDSINTNVVQDAYDEYSLKEAESQNLKTIKSSNKKYLNYTTKNYDFVPKESLYYEGAHNYFATQYKDLSVDKEGNPTQFLNAVDTLYKNMDKYNLKVKLSPNDNKNGIYVNILGEDGTTIISYPYTQRKIKKAYSLLNQAPEYYVFVGLDVIATEIKAAKTMGNNLQIASYNNLINYLNRKNTENNEQPTN